MARPKKTGLDYFPFDVDFFDDEKIVAIAGEFGLKGEITAIKLLCAVYRNGYFIEWSEMLKMKMLRSLPGIGPELLEQIVNRLVKWGFFDKALFDSVRVLTSRGIQRRFLNGSKRRTSAEENPPYWLFPKTEKNVSADRNPPKKGFLYTKTPHQQEFLSTESTQSKVNKRKKSSTDVEDTKRPPSPPPIHELSLDEEIQALKAEDLWLDQLQLLHHVPVDTLRQRLDEFRLHCASDGKERHESLADAKQHFNNWLRIVAAKQSDCDAENKSRTRNRRKGHLLKADEKKDFGGTF